MVDRTYEMAVIEAKLERMGLKLPESPAPVASCVPAVRTGNLLFLSGVGMSSLPNNIPVEIEMVVEVYD